MAATREDLIKWGEFHGQEFVERVLNTLKTLEPIDGQTGFKRQQIAEVANPADPTDEFRWTRHVLEMFVVLGVVAKARAKRVGKSRGRVAVLYTLVDHDYVPNIPPRPPKPEKDVDVEVATDE